MKELLLSKIIKSQKHQILHEIKKSQGLSVGELCKKVNLSYMGVKQHCIKMERDGYLDTWNRHKGMGRPEKAYRITEEAVDFFPKEYTDLTGKILESIAQVYGVTAIEKILYKIYETMTQEIQKSLGEELGEEYDTEARAKKFAAVREEAGYMSEYYFNPDVQKHQVVEYHSPIFEVLERFPIVRDFERKMFENVLLCGIERKEEKVSGLYKAIFTLQT